ncbi:MAG: HDIG domain-containing protein [Chloroflexi bacterium]|nr:HDIG domain-containing protein [Chloroflexota bacterium]
MSIDVMCLPPGVHELGQRLAAEFARRNAELFLVGGMVRDLELHAGVGQDVDFATSAAPTVTSAALKAAGGKVFSVGEKFGTIGAVFDAPPLHVEVTTYRAEAYTPGSRKPSVAFGGSLEDDLARRDFTINAIALDLRSGALRDPLGGVRDLEVGLVRAVGEPAERFREDPLRLLRAVRFASRLGFLIEPATADAVCAAAPALAGISRERVRDELEKILLGPAPARGIELLCDLGLAPFSLPAVPKLRGMQQEAGRHKDVFSHTLQVLDRTPPRTALRWAALLHDIAKPNTKRVEDGKVTFHGHDHKGARMARRILTELHQPTELITRVERLVGLHLRANAYAGEWTDSAVRRLVREVGDDLLEDLLALSRADVTTGRVERRVAIARSVAELEQRIKELREQEDIARLTSPLDGIELMALFGRGPGAWIRPIKEQLTEMVIDGELGADDKAWAGEIARRLYEQLELADAPERASRRTTSRE